LEDDFVEGSATTEQETFTKNGIGIDFHQATGENEVLLDLGRRDPRALL
jgi:hypothetical protein